MTAIHACEGITPTHDDTTTVSIEWPLQTIYLVVMRTKRSRDRYILSLAPIAFFMISGKLRSTSRQSRVAESPCDGDAVLVLLYL
jgi:hypothetical protein